MVNDEVLFASLVSSGLSWHGDGSVTMIARKIHAIDDKGVENLRALPPSVFLSL